MKELALRDRPREKLLRVGATALGDNELVALVLGTGSRGRGALVVAQQVLSDSGGPVGLGRMSLEELCRVPGVGPTRAARVLAAVELGRRAVFDRAGERPRLLRSSEAAEYLLPLFGSHPVERFGVLLLDVKRRVIRVTVLSTGTLDASVCHPRDVFKAAMLAGAGSVVVFHNHPSGDPSPSREDIRLTRALCAAGELMDIPVTDHVILGNGCYVCLREAGLL